MSGLGTVQVFDLLPEYLQNAVYLEASKQHNGQEQPNIADGKFQAARNPRLLQDAIGTVVQRHFYTLGAQVQTNIKRRAYKLLTPEQRDGWNKGNVFVSTACILQAISVESEMRRAALQGDYQEWVLNSPLEEQAERMQAWKAIERCFECGGADLDLSDCKITSMPGCVGKLGRLRYLNLRNTLIAELPVGITRLTSLESLILTNTRIQVLPKEIGDLTSLRILFLGNTPLKELPKEIGKLTGLTDLHLYKTDLRVLPNTVGNLEKLRELTLVGTPLEGLPDDIKGLTQLKILSLSGDLAQKILGVLCLLPKSCEVDFSSSVTAEGELLLRGQVNGPRFVFPPRKAEEALPQAVSIS